MQKKSLDGAKYFPPLFFKKRRKKWGCQAPHSATHIFFCLPWIPRLLAPPLDLIPWCCWSPNLSLSSSLNLDKSSSSSSHSFSDISFSFEYFFLKKRKGSSHENPNFFLQPPPRLSVLFCADPQIWKFSPAHLLTNYSHKNDVKKVSFPQTKHPFCHTAGDGCFLEGW